MLGFRILVDWSPTRPIFNAKGGIFLNFCGIGSKNVFTVSNVLPLSIESTVVRESIFE